MDGSTSGRRGAAERCLEPGPQVLRLVVDVIQQCNLRCTYCHPGDVWQVQHLGADAVRRALAATERYGALEVVLSGGEPTLHPQFELVLDATHELSRTRAVLVTKGTRVNDRLAGMIGRANLARVCVSLDSADAATHASARGDNHKRVVEGLQRLRATGLPVTVISVVHQGNYRRIGELSDWLADERLADQHHLCSPSYSGEAKQHYPDLALEWDDYFAVQATVDDRHVALARRGLFVTFNSFWPATGKRSTVVDAGRTMTLQESDPYDLLTTADQRYRDGSFGQLPRAVEAQHKFQLGGCGSQTTDRLIDDDAAQPVELTRLVKLRPMTSLSLLDNPIRAEEQKAVTAALADGSGRFRCVRHTSGVGVVYDTRQSHVTLLHEAEWERLANASLSTL